MTREGKRRRTWRVKLGKWYWLGGGWQPGQKVGGEHMQNRPADARVFATRKAAREAVAAARAAFDGHPAFRSRGERAIREVPQW